MNEEEKKDLEEKQLRNHKKVKTIFKIIGPIVIVAGLVFAIIGFADFISSASNFEQPTKFWCLFIGLPAMAFGGMFTLAGFRKEIMRYNMHETTPVFNEAGKQIQPGISAISNAVKNSDAPICPVCGSLNDKDSAFCKKCGAALSKTCPHCGASLDADANFCDKCGKKLSDEQKI